MADKICIHTNSKIDNIKDRVLEKSLKSIIEKEGYLNYEIVTRKFNTGGGKAVDGEKETNLFVKKAINFEKIITLNGNEVIHKELFVYIDLSPVVTHLQDTAKVPSEDRFKIPKAYSESSEHALIFENLAKKGFKTYGKYDILPLKYMELAIQELGRFHGISFVIEQRMPDFYENKIKTQKSPFNFNDDWKGLMEKIFLYTASLLGGETKRRIEDYLPIAIKKYPVYDNDQTSDGEPAEVITVDYQLLDYGCPLRDLLFFIYSTTSKDFRREHMVYKEWKDYGLIRTLYSSVFLFAPDSGLDVSKLCLAELPYEPGPEVQERVRGWIEEFIEDGYL
ncbi:uncharacterized protein LOC112045631 [Bicyclus anynana]|uniref:Uncharacterized protein LOC112045631 n=1 Tax=Bicyclus anynana TaxID=110368 RepID=A0ABM3LS38_BICAN|nr:uncharacterized protein LOC112045631 [Bicyclus anynana]